MAKSKIPKAARERLYKWSKYHCLICGTTPVINNETGQFELTKSNGLKCIKTKVDPITQVSRTIAVPLTVDHLIPLNHGGSNTIENYIVLCGHCNGSKSSKDPEKWIEDLRFQNIISFDKYKLLLQRIDIAKKNY